MKDANAQLNSDMECITIIQRIILLNYTAQNVCKHLTCTM